MHVVFRESHGLDETETPTDLGQTPADLVVLCLPDDAIAQGSCSAAAFQAASQSGGQVLSVTTAQQGGRTVCIVTVLVPGRDGGRPRRVTLTIPQ